jgi:hypothetical protein
MRVPEMFFLVSGAGCVHLFLNSSFSITGFSRERFSSRSFYLMRNFEGGHGNVTNGKSSS